MGLFDDKSHIKKTKELKNALKKVPGLTPEEEKKVFDRAKKEIMRPSGMSKEEYLKKVVRPLEKNTKDIIDPKEARRLKKLAE